MHIYNVCSVHIGMSTSSLHRESTDSDIVRSGTVYYHSTEEIHMELNHVMLATILKPAARFKAVRKAIAPVSKLSERKLQFQCWLAG